MCTTGALLCGASIGYYLMLPKPPLVIYIEGAMIEFGLGWCFYMVMIAGSLCLFIGLIVSAMDLIWPHKFSTILEVYYDTPYDRHVILEESHDVRYRKRNSKGGLEEPVSLGSRILRWKFFEFNWNFCEITKTFFQTFIVKNSRANSQRHQPNGHRKPRLPARPRTKISMALSFQTKSSANNSTNHFTRLNVNDRVSCKCKWSSSKCSHS